MTFTDDNSSNSDQQSFSDADLKYLKEDVEPGSSHCIPSWQFLALLTRLEASERVADELAKVHGHSTGSLMDIQSCTLCKILKAWRKAAGK